MIMIKIKFKREPVSPCKPCSTSADHLYSFPSMLSAKPWKTSAVLRLFFSLFLCILGGSLVMAALHFHPANTHARLRFYAPLAAALGFLAGAQVLLWRPWRFERLLWRLAGILACVYGALLLGYWAQTMAPTTAASLAQMVVGLLSLQGAALVLVWPFLREHRITWSQAFGMANGWPRAMGLGLLVACLFLPIGWSLQFGSSKLIEWAGERLPRLGLKPEQEQAVETAELAVSLRSRILLGVLTILLAPMAEEILFRGILYPWIKQAGYPRLAWWGSALLFAALHMNLVSFVPLTLLALVLAALYERTDNLIAPISTHALFNCVNLAFLYHAQDLMTRSR
jgi:membrane protease YdiL (CAAX protease family)